VLNEFGHGLPVGLIRRVPLLGQLLAVGGTASVLPYDRVIQAVAGLAFPQDRCFTLIGDADGRYVCGPNVCGRDGLTSDLQNRRPDHFRILLYPTVVRIAAVDALLGAGHHRTGGIV